MFSTDVPCMAALRDKTMLFVFFSAFTTLNSDIEPSRYWVSLTGLTSTSEPGRKALIWSTRTVNPPLTLV